MMRYHRAYEHTEVACNNACITALVTRIHRKGKPMMHGFSSPRFRPPVLVLVRCLLWLGSLLWLTGCATQLPPPPSIPWPEMQQLAHRLEWTSQIDDHTAATYKIEVGDLLHVDLPSDPGLSHDVLVRANGTFAYAYIGTVQAQGLTLDQLETQMGQRLAEAGIVALNLGVTMVEHGRKQVYVLGAVHLPGVYPLLQETTLLSLIAQAGGLTADAGWLALVIRDVWQHPRSKSNSEASTGHMPPAALRLDLQNLLIGEGPPDFRLARGDTLYIPHGAYYQVIGRVKAPGRYSLQRNTTVLQAIAQAGGFASFAAKNRLTIWRYHVHNDKCGGTLCLRGIARFTIDQPQEFQVHMHEVVEPGDVLVVPGGLF
jgi:polysaccharide biosynthesis/export protein